MCASYMLAPGGNLGLELFVCFLQSCVESPEGCAAATKHIWLQLQSPYGKS